MSGIKSGIEKINNNKSGESRKCIKECDICHYWYFLDKNNNYEPYLCNGCHDLMQKAMNFNDVAIVSIKGKKLDYYKTFSLYIKDEWKKLLSKKNREVILNRAKDYYENNNKLLRERAKNKYRELS